MTERDLLEYAVLVEPLDDTPRLVLADHLDESGDAARAECLRLGVAVERGAASAADQDRYAELMSNHAPGWASDRLGADDRLELRRSWWDGGRGEAPRLVLTVLPYSLRARAATGRTDPAEQLPLSHDRGYVTGITGTYEQLFGGWGTACDGCRGLGAVHPEFAEPEAAGCRTPRRPNLHPLPRRTCPACGGTGWGTGVSKAVFAAWPLTRATLTGFRPYAAAHAPAPGGMRMIRPRPAAFLWTNSGRLASGGPSVVPWELFDKLPPGTAPGRKDTASYKAYAAREHAEEALRRAAVNLGRSRLGLPGLWKDDPL